MDKGPLVTNRELAEFFVICAFLLVKIVFFGALIIYMASDMAGTLPH